MGEADRYQLHRLCLGGSAHVHIREELFRKHTHEMGERSRMHVMTAVDNAFRSEECVDGDDSNKCREESKPRI